MKVSSMLTQTLLLLSLGNENKKETLIIIDRKCLSITQVLYLT
mgnify:FL=1